MKRIIMGLSLLLVALAMTGCYQRVDAGNVGIKWNKYGSNKGVDLVTLQPVGYWLTWNEEVTQFPTFLQTYKWSSNPAEGGNGDESFTFQVAGGMPVNVDVGITYQILPENAPGVFQKFRRSVDEITDSFIRNDVRKQLVNHAGNMSMDTMINGGAVKLLADVQVDVIKDMDQYGIKVDSLSWLSPPRFPKEIQGAINAKLQSTQMAEQRQNEVAQATAEGAKEVALATARAQATLVQAQADAQAMTLKNTAIKDSPQLVEYTKAQKWNGVLPQTVMGSNVTPFLQTSLK